MSKKAYFDHSATTPVDKEVFEAMKPYFSDDFGNSGSLHQFGQKAVAAVDDSREQLAEFLGCKTNEIIFTSGATESDNIAIQGLVKSGEHIITSKIEHPAIIEPCEYLEKNGVQVTYLPVGQDGLISIDELKKSIKENTRLISIMYANNEIGTIQPISDIGELLKTENENRKQKGLSKIFFHTDAVQAAYYCDMNVDSLGVDMLSISAHKIYGPKGIGVFYRRSGTPVKAIQFGGHQEYGLRSGTVNIPAVVGIGKAIELIKDKNHEKVKENIKELRDHLLEGMKKAIPDMIINGSLEKRVEGNAHFSFKGIEGESMLLLLDQEGIAVSTGSACSSGSLEPSHVLVALGVDILLAHGSLRVTLGKYNTKQDIDYLIEKLPPIVDKLKELSPIKS